MKTDNNQCDWSIVWHTYPDKVKDVVHWWDSKGETATGSLQFSVSLTSIVSTSTVTSIVLLRLPNMKSKQFFCSGVIIELLAEPQWIKTLMALAMTKGIKWNYLPLVNVVVEVTSFAVMSWIQTYLYEICGLVHTGTVVLNNQIKCCPSMAGSPKRSVNSMGLATIITHSSLQVFNTILCSMVSG